MITTHEADEAGRIACRPSFTAAGRPDLALKPGASTCGHQACRKIRMRIRLSWPSTGEPSWFDDWSTPFTPAQVYALCAYADLRSAICPGSTGHEGGRASAVFCDACIANAIAAAYEAGQKWAGY
jgi:hypothetical protein